MFVCALSEKFGCQKCSITLKVGDYWIKPLFNVTSMGLSRITPNYLTSFDCLKVRLLNIMFGGFVFSLLEIVIKYQFCRCSKQGNLHCTNCLIDGCFFH